MKYRLSFLFLAATLLTVSVAFVSCSKQKLSSEELFFQALEQESAALYKDAVHSFSLCIENEDEWAAVASEQLLELLSGHPDLDISQAVRKKARSYHPVKNETINTKKEYPLTYSAESLASFSADVIEKIASWWSSSDTDKLAAATLLEEAVSVKSGRLNSPEAKEAFWMLVFYTGRLYEKNGSSTYKTALSFYDDARTSSYSDLTYDRSLWYLLELSRKINPRSTAETLSQFSKTWHDNAYFDDFFDRLAADILSNYDWESFHLVFQENQSFMSPSIKAKYAYISARLFDTRLLTTGDSEKDHTLTAALYETVLNNADYGSYYDLLAHYITENPFTLESADTSSEREGVTFAERLLGGLVSHDFPELTSRYLSNCYSQLSTPVMQDIYSYLLTKKGSEKSYLDLTSLALKTFRERQGDSEMMKLAFPTYYRTYVEAESRQTGLDPWLLFGLIHSESCFQAEITSTAGAHGLTQLMDSTAGDIARKLKMKEYDLDDAATNVKFGSFYLAELISRLDDDILLAVFSYNAGITRVRNWKKQAPELPSDIFLETLPYEETRLYGQKVTRAAVLYGMLYYNQNFPDLIQSIMDIPY